MTDAEIVEMGVDGAPRYRVAAARIQQNPDDLSVRLEQMKLTYRTEADQAVDADGRQRFVPPGSRVIDLAGDVEVNGLPLQGTAPAVLRTERLRLDTQASIATTNDRRRHPLGQPTAVLDGPESRLEGARSCRLESSVHGRFVR